MVEEWERPMMLEALDDGKEWPTGRFLSRRVVGTSAERNIPIFKDE